MHIFKVQIVCFSLFVWVARQSEWKILHTSSWMKSTTNYQLAPSYPTSVHSLIATLCIRYTNDHNWIAWIQIIVLCLFQLSFRLGQYCVSAMEWVSHPLAFYYMRWLNWCIMPSAKILFLFGLARVEELALKAVQLLSPKQPLMVCYAVPLNS